MLPTFTFSSQLLKYPIEKAGRLSLDLTLYKSGLKGSKVAYVSSANLLPPSLLEYNRERKKRTYYVSC
jgi:hypothetical protein